MRDILERHQVWIYLVGVVLGVAAATGVTGTERLQASINPALAFMLFVTFLQVPLAEIGKGFREMRFLAALLTTISNSADTADTECYTSCGLCRTGQWRCSAWIGTRFLAWDGEELRESSAGKSRPRSFIASCCFR